MIVARIWKGNGTIIQTGSVKILKYEDPNDGWFPVESFQFGFTPQSTGSTGAAHGPATKSAAPIQASSPDRGGAGTKPDLTLTKHIDTATSSIMSCVMEQRSSKKGTDSS